MKKIAAGFIVGLFSLQAWGDGFYVASDLGRGKWRDEDSNQAVYANQIGIAGGYEFSLPFQDSMAIELGYRDLGGIKEGDKNNNLKSDLTAVQLSLVAAHNFTESISAYGRLGYADLHVKSRYNYYGQKDTTTASHEKVYVGLGGRYEWANRFGLRIEYNRYDKISDSVVISAVLVGGDFHF